MIYYLHAIPGRKEHHISEKISSQEKPPRIPPAADGIPVNFCKNPTCKNYGVLPLERVPRGWHPKGAILDTYSLALGGARAVPRLHCQLCNEDPPIKSNQAIAEERARMLSALRPRPAPACPDASCPFHTVPITNGTAHYQSFGQTRFGSHRYRCRACHRTFSVGSTTTRQRLPHKNRTLFALLMNKSPFRRVCEVADINENTIYRKIDFLAARCQAFVADREHRLLTGLPIRRLYLATDRQDYVVNWAQHEDRRNVILHAVGTADNEAGYVFGVHLNYDSTLDAERIEAEAERSGDLRTRPPFRRYARCWLAADTLRPFNVRRISAGPETIP
jgi:transposase-like protein